MRLLFTCVAGSQQHLQCLLPLVRAAVAAGDEVALASGPDRADSARLHGIPFHPVGHSFRELVARSRTDLPGYAVGGEDEERRTYAGFFAGLAGPPAAADLMAVMEAYNPDLVIHETAEFGAPLAATARGVPYATMAWGLPIPVGYLDAAGEALATTWREYGLTPHPHGGMDRHVGIDVFPASLRPPYDGPQRQETRPGAAIDPRAHKLSAWIEPLPKRPTVHISFGTAAFNRDVELIRIIIEALADENLNVVAVVGPDNDPAELGTLPANTTAAPFIPHAVLMPHCDAVITHGGSGTTLSALEHGVPLLVIPQGADQYRTAAAVEDAAAGVTITGHPEPEVTRAAVRMVLRHPVIRAGAAMVAAEIAAMPTPAETLTALKEALIPHRRDATGVS